MDTLFLGPMSQALSWASKRYAENTTEAIGWLSRVPVWEEVLIAPSFSVKSLVPWLVLAVRAGELPQVTKFVLLPPASPNDLRLLQSAGFPAEVWTPHG